MAYKSDGSGGREVVGGRGAGLGGAGGGRSTSGNGRGGGGNAGNRDRDPGTSSGRNKMDAKTKRALEDAFNDPSRQLDTMSNEKAWRDADRDALGMNPDGTRSLDQMLGQALGALSPVEEARPWDDPDYKPVDGQYPSDANWKADIGEAIGGVIGAATGAIGLGTITGGINDLLDKPIPDVNLGADVLGGGSGTKAPPASGSDGEPKELINDAQGQPTQPATPPKPPAGPVGLPDIWEYPDEADLAASAPQDGLSDEERRRRGNTSIVVLGQGGLAI